MVRSISYFEFIVIDLIHLVSSNVSSRENVILIEQVSTLIPLSLMYSH